MENWLLCITQKDAFERQLKVDLGNLISMCEKNIILE